MMCLVLGIGDKENSLTSWGLCDNEGDRWQWTVTQFYTHTHMLTHMHILTTGCGMC